MIMTPQEKAAAYDKAIERTRRMIEDYKNRGLDNYYACAKENIDYNFPELAESEDERIRKAIRNLVLSVEQERLSILNITRSDILAWLEKRAKNFTKKDVDDAYLKGITDTKNEIEKQYEANYQIRKDIATFIFNYKGDIKDMAKWIDYLGIKVFFVEKQGEKKPADKIGPKFHEGDWIIDDNIKNPFLITDTSNGKYDVISTYGNDFVFSFNEIEHFYHLWTIQDAKDGDVLVYDNGCVKIILLFKKWLYGVGKGAYSYAHIISSGHHIHTNGWSDCGLSAHPATKEQRVQLEKAMADAGYTFDFDKKELKKIEDEIEIPYGAKDSELQEASYHIPEGFHAEIDGNRVVIKRGEQILANSEKTCKDEQKPTDKVDQHSLPVSDDSSLPTFDESIYHPCTEKAYEQRSSEWSEGDDINLGKAIWYVENPEPMVVKDSMLVEWLKSLKGKVQPKMEWSEKYIADVFEKVGLAKIAREQGYDALTEAIQSAMIELSKFTPQPKQEWSEKDEYHRRQILRILKNSGCSRTLQEKIGKWIEERLKSLRLQLQWKPSDGQIEALDFAVDSIVPAEFWFKRKELKGLLEQLKKLREE